MPKSAVKSVQDGFRLAVVTKRDLSTQSCDHKVAIAQVAENIEG
jgi:hypothetical protein